MGPHDKAFRALMHEKGVAEALLRERLPAALVARFAGSPEPLSESFVDEALGGSTADLVLRVPLRNGRPAYVCCLVEHKRTEDRFALVQVLRYLTALYTRFAKRLPAAEPLPLIVPLIIYNGQKPWRGPRRFSALLRVPPSLQRYALDFGVLLVDVGAEGAAGLSTNRTLKGGLLALKAAATPRAELPAVLRQMLKVLAQDESTLRFFLRYLAGTVGRDALPLLEQEARRQPPGKETMMQTISEFLESRGYRRGKRHGFSTGQRQGLVQGREEGREVGREEGREEGREAALRDVLRRVLVKRFKRVPASVEAKLAAADAPALLDWCERAVTARSLRSLFERH